MPIPDTHAHIKVLIQAGFSEAQAEAQIKIWLDWIKADLATKQDLHDLETRLRQEIKNLETRLRQEIKDLEIRLTEKMQSLLKWVAGLFLIQTGLISALMGMVLTLLLQAPK